MPKWKKKEQEKEVKKTLYERLGGDEQMSLLVGNVFDEMKEDPKLGRFLKNVPVHALAHHQLNMFRVLLGPEDKQPDPSAFLDYMLATHVRMFRDYGLNEEHFDMVASCLVTGFQNMQVEQDLIDQVASQMTPLRGIFEYGAKVAEQEKSLTEEELEMLPEACAKTLGTDQKVAFRDPASMDIPSWLPETLERYSGEANVRAWTCELTNQFGPSGNKDIADTFMDMPYMNHHVYLVAFLQLAFLPEGYDPSELLGMVRFPRGPMNDPLCLDLWDRMVAQFVRVAKDMFMETLAITRALNKLRSYSNHFPDVPIKKVNGLKTPHLLQQFVAPDDDSNQAPLVGAPAKEKFDGESSTSFSTISRETSATTATPSDDSGLQKKAGKKRNKKRVWRRLFGWIMV